MEQHRDGRLPLAVRRRSLFDASMKTRAAVLWGTHQEWKIEDIEVDEPKNGEVLIRWLAAGLCHSD